MSSPAQPSRPPPFFNMTARKRFPAQLHLRVGPYCKSHLTAKFLEHLHGSGGLVSEMEVVAFMYFASLQLLLQNPLRELLWGHEGKIASERKHQNRIQPGRSEQS